MVAKDDEKPFFPQHLVSVITKEPLLRDRHDIDLVLPWLQKKIPLFNELNRECLFDIVRNCDYEKYEKNDVIIRQGERGYRFYLVLRGTVDIYIDPTISGEDNVNATQRQNTVLSSKSVSKHDAGSDVKTPKSASSKKSYEDGERKKIYKPFHVKREREFYGKHLGKQNGGYGFGEIALISDDNRRNATIIADDTTDVLVIHKDLYDRSLKQFQEQEYVDRREFVDHHLYFGKWSPKFRRLLEMSFKREVYNYDATIFRQGDPVNGLYFVRSGRVRVTMDPHKHYTQYASMAPFPTQNDVFELESLRPPKKKDPLAPIQNHDTSVLRPKRRGAEPTEKQCKAVTICGAGEGECFGDLEVLTNMDTMMATITCMERTEIYFLDMKNFDRLIQKKNPTTFDLMRFNVVTKLRTRVTSQQGRQIPIFKHLLFSLTEKADPIFKTLPDVLTNKDVPSGSLLESYQVAAFLKDKAELLKPSVPAAFYYKILMEERAKERHRMRKVAKFGLRHKKAMFAMRAPRSLTTLMKVEEPERLPTPVFEKTELPEDPADTPVNEYGLHEEETEKKEKKVVFDLDGDRKQEKTKPKEKKPVTKKKSKESIKEEFEERPPSRRKPFNDWETSEKRLGDLEDKVKTFAKNASLTAYGYRIKTPCLPKLRRYTAQQLDIPRPGGKVVIKSRQCQFANSQFLVKNHKHIRYHMVTRDPFPPSDPFPSSDIPLTQSV